MSCTTLSRGVLTPDEEGGNGFDIPCHICYRHYFLKTTHLGVFVRYILAIIFPPLAVLLCGKPVQAVLNIVLTLLGWFPGMIHAILAVNSHKADKRAARIERAIKAA